MRTVTEPSPAPPRTLTEIQAGAASELDAHRRAIEGDLARAVHHAVLYDPITLRLLSLGKALIIEYARLRRQRDHDEAMIGRLTSRVHRLEAAVAELRRRP